MIREGSTTPAPRSIGRSTAIFAVWTGVSRVAGLAREILAAAIFGTQGSIAAFVIAFQVPNFLRSLVADSALSAAFVPVFTELEEQGRRREAQRLAGALIGVITMGLGAVTLVAIVAAPWIMPVLAPGLSPELVDQTVDLAQIMFPIVVLLGLTGLVAAILQANGEFGATAFALTRSRTKAAKLLELGADRVLIDGEDDVVAVVRSLTDGKGVDIVFDPVGGEGLTTLANTLGAKGALIVYGFLGGFAAPLPTNWPLTIHKYANPAFLADRAGLRRAQHFINAGLLSGAFAPVIDRAFDLSEITDAHRYLEKNVHVGKVVVTVQQ